MNATNRPQLTPAILRNNYTKNECLQTACILGLKSAEGIQSTLPLLTSVLNVISNRREIHEQLPVLCDHSLLIGCCNACFQTVHCTKSTNSSRSEETSSFREYSHTFPLHLPSTWGKPSRVPSCRLRPSNVRMIKKIRI